MEINYNKSNIGASEDTDYEESLINVRAIISCPSCNYKKTFKNQFHHQKLENMIVALKVFDWMTCNKCGEILNLNLEFEI